MKALTQTIIVLVAVSLMTAGLCLAQNVPDKETRDALAARKDAEVAAKIAGKQAEAAQQQMQAAQQQMEAAQRQMEVERTQELVAALAAQQAPNVPASAAPVPPKVMLPSFSVNNPWPWGSGGIGAVLVIPTAEIKTEDLITVTEDMNVMSRIFEKNLQDARIALVGSGGLFVDGRDMLGAMFARGRQTTQGIYLQGYGALFLMKVDFPLSPPPQVEEEKEKQAKEEEADPVWEQMRQEMYEPQEAATRKAEQPEEKYDAGKVESLKTTLIEALKHAANIRSLKPDESVILTVTGSGEAVSGTATVMTQTIVVSGHERTVQQLAPSGSSQTVLVIRAKKSDIDNFAEGSLDSDQFVQRTQVLTCPCLGGAAGSGDPFSGSYFHKTRR